MIRKLPPAYPPSGQQLLLYGAALNEAPREVLLEVLEWLFAKEQVQHEESLQREKNLRGNVIAQMSRLRTAQRA
jgi:hypothetical protein